MRHAYALRTVVGISLISLAASPLAGCNGGTSALPAAPMTSSPAAGSASARMTAPNALGSMGADNRVESDKKGTKLLFVSSNENNRIDVYNTATKQQNPPVLRTITSGVDGPNGIAVDKSGNLYVANYVSNNVTIYAPNASTPKATLSSGLNGPWDVKVDGFGNVYVANDPLYGGVPFIVEYLAGNSSPTYTWDGPTSGMTISGIALLDPTVSGETSIYALGYTENYSGFASGVALSCYPGNYTCVSLGDSFGETGGIAVAESPGMSKPFQWIAVDQYIPGIDIFTLNQATQQMSTGGTPEFVTLNAKGNQLYLADRFYGRVTEYSYPGRKTLNTYNPGGQIYGVATYPSGSLH